MKRQTRRSTLGLGLALLLCAGVAPAAGCGDDDGGVDPPTVISRDEALGACLAADACGIRTFAYATSFCLDSGWDRQYHTGAIPIWNSIYQCVLLAQGDCDVIEACFGMGEPLADCTEPGDGYCLNNVRYYCDTMQQKIFVENCYLAGQTCAMAQVTATEVAPKCSAGVCNEGDEAQCHGNLLWSCSGGAWEVTDCSAQQMICGDTDLGSKACVGAGIACLETVVDPHCEGNVAVACVHGHTQNLDCTLLPGTKICNPDTARCESAGTECDSTSGELCQGATIRICVDGFNTNIDCAELGFGQCEVVTGGGAHCRR